MRKTFIIKLLLLVIPTLGIMLTLTHKAKADIILPGEKIITVCHRVSNVSEYPDYRIIYSPVGPPGSNDAWYAEADNRCFAGIYKMADNPRFYAVSASEFNESKLGDISKFGSSLLPSDTTLYMSDDREVPEDDPTDTITYTYTIIRIDCDKLWIYPISKEIKYVDGSSNVAIFDVPSLPAPSSCGEDSDNNFQDNSTLLDNDTEQDTDTQEQNTDASEDTESSDNGEALGTKNRTLEKVKDVVFSPIGIAVMVFSVLGGLGLGVVAIIILNKKLRKKTA